MGHIERGGQPRFVSIIPKQKIVPCFSDPIGWQIYIGMLKDYINSYS